MAAVLHRKADSVDAIVAEGVAERERLVGRKGQRLRSSTVAIIDRPSPGIAGVRVKERSIGGKRSTFVQCLVAAQRNDGRVVDGRDAERRSGNVAGRLSVADWVSEAGRAVVILVWRVNEAAIRTKDELAMEWRSNRRSGEASTVHISVVNQHAGRCDVQGRVFDR